MVERWGALPLGELHPMDRCALCGASGSTLGGEGDFDVDLEQTILAVTRARALVCVDVSACERRRYNQRRRIQ